MEHKYRAWDTVLGEMLYPEWEEHIIGGRDLSCYVYNSKKALGNHSTLSWILYQPEFEVEQFTGLRDSKRTDEFPEGQEIYAGDKVDCVGWWPGIVTWQSEGSIGWCIEPAEGYERKARYGLNDNYHFTVTGTIHDIPEQAEQT